MQGARWIAALVAALLACGAPVVQAARQVVALVLVQSVAAAASWR
jgi:hypothetical protein